MKIICRILGGLGNQMFQYAAARSVAEKFNAELLIDDSIIRNPSPKNEGLNRPLALSIFNIDLKYSSSIQRFRHNSHGLPLPIRGMSRIIRLIYGSGVTTPKTFRYDASILSAQRPPQYLCGLWQSPLYFQRFESIIRNEFSFLRPLSKDLGPLINIIENPNTICLHVRRGDYISIKINADTIGFVGINYYKKAIAYLQKKMNIKNVVIFSDDLEWCQSNFEWLEYDKVFTNYPLEDESLRMEIDLHLMTKGKNFIISNSTYAWWGAWLSWNREKNIIAPMNWFKDPKLDSSDLCPSSWIRL